MRVFDKAPENMRLIWENSAQFADRPYISFEDESINYTDTHAMVRSLAHYLAFEGDVGAGDRVAIAMRNYPEWIIAYWATIVIGASAVGINAWWTPTEIKYALNDSKPKVLFADDERLRRVLEILPEVRQISPMRVVAVRSDRQLPTDATNWEDHVDTAGAPSELPPANIAADDDMSIHYTSGTTGFPKGAQLTHRGSVHNVLHIAFANAVVTAATEKLAAASGAATETAASGSVSEGGRPVMMVPTPLFHVTASNCMLHPATLTGGQIVLLHHWDPARALELIERRRVRTFVGVPTMARELVTHPDWHLRDTSSLTSLGGGGAAIQPDLVAKIDAADGRVQPSTGYGLTETHGVVTTVSNAFFAARPTSAGFVMPTFEYKVIDEDGHRVPRGARGELCVKGPAVIKGYINCPEETAEVIKDGWFGTGDIVYLDEDEFVHIVDRAKDMVLRGGENVYCAEVEAAIYQHRDVAEAVVFSVPDERLGETVGAAIHLTPNATLNNTELNAHLAPLIAKFKQPEHVWFVNERLPQNANGKFLKRQIRKKLIATLPIRPLTHQNQET